MERATELDRTGSCQDSGPGRSLGWVSWTERAMERATETAIGQETGWVLGRARLT